MKFVRGGNHLATCRCCGKKTHSNTGGVWDVDLCPTCLRSEEQRNGHSDNGDHTDKNKKTCPDCAGLDCLHLLAKAEAR